MKNSIFFTLISSILLTSCSINGTHRVMHNLDLFNNNDVNIFINLDVETIKSQINTGNEFIVYLTSPGCSSCDQLVPYITNYIKENKYLTYRLDVVNQKNIFEQFTLELGEYFGKKDDDGNIVFSYPSIYIVKNYLITEIPYSKLTTNMMVFNTMNSYIKENKIFYGNEKSLEIINNSTYFEDNLNFLFVSFDINSINLVNLYKTHFADYICSLNKTIIISNERYQKNEIIFKKLIKLNNKISVIDEATCKDNSNIEYIKNFVN